MIDSLKNLLHNKETEKLLEMLSANPEVLDAKDANETSGFLLVAYSGNQPVFQKAKAVRKNFSFQEAVIAGRIDLVNERLLNNPTLANQYSTDGFTPLALAAFFNETEIARLLIRHGANPGLSATNQSRVNALHSAVAKENLELCELFLLNGADVNAPQMQNVTALHSASHKGNLQIVKLLVENGANIESKMDNGDTALAIAERDGHHPVASFLKQFSPGNNHSS